VFAALAVVAGVLAVTAFLLPAHPVLGKVFGSSILKRFNTKATTLVTGIVLVIAFALTLSLPLFARLYNERGTRLQNREQPDLVAAREYYKQALRLNPSSGQAHYNLASTYEESEPERAIEEYTIAIQCDSNIRPAYTRLAHLYNDKGYQYHKQGDISHALEMYQRAVNSDQTYAKAHYNLAVAYEDSHEFSKANEEYRIAIKCDNHLVRAHNNLARLYLSTGKDKQDYEYALNLLRDALNWSPQDEEDRYSLYKNFGWANYALGHLDIAEDYLNGAIRLRPDKAAAHCLLAYMLKRLGRTRAAAENCYNCVSLSYGEKDVEPIWLTDAQQSFKEGGCNEAK
jgi:Tfp pilus assembly protein PilF